MTSPQRSRTLNDYIYNSWKRMHTRCYDRSYHSYHRYGGRGILVCERWLEYSNFKADMGGTYYIGASLERLNNNQGYHPDNCAWVPKHLNNKPLKYDLDEMLTLYTSGMTQTQVGELFGLTQDRVSKLLKRARRDAHSA